MSGYAVLVTGLGAYLAAAILIRARQVTRDRRRATETTRRDLETARLAAAREAARMADRHPEKPLPPGQYEAIWNGGDYLLWDGELTGAEAAALRDHLQALGLLPPHDHPGGTP